MRDQIYAEAMNMTERRHLNERLAPRTALDEEWAKCRLALTHTDVSNLLNLGVDVAEIYDKGMVGKASIDTENGMVDVYVRAIRDSVDSRIVAIRQLNGSMYAGSPQTESRQAPAR